MLEPFYSREFINNVLTNLVNHKYMKNKQIFHVLESFNNVINKLSTNKIW